MGIKESYPEIKGTSEKINSKNENVFFNRVHRLLREYSSSNKHKNYNLLKKLEKKSFKNNYIKKEKEDLRRYTWDEYFLLKINKLNERYKPFWISNLIAQLKKKIFFFQKINFALNFFIVNIK